MSVEVWSSNEEGDLITNVVTATTVSDSTYSAANLPPGVYRLRIPASEFGTGEPPQTLDTSSTLRYDEDGHVDGNNNGLQSAPPNRSSARSSP